MKQSRQEDLIANIVRRGFVAYPKGDSVEIEQAPAYGEITLKFKDGKFYQLETKTTKK